MKRLLALIALFLALLAVAPAAEKAQFVVPPEVVIRHTPERSFIGPGMLALENGDILMAAPWGRPPTNFEQIAAKFPVPMLYRRTDGGRTWREQGRMKMEWNQTGLISDGGTSFLRLRDGRIAVVFNRHVKGLHGGGTPVIAFSADNGQTWTAAKVLIENDDAFYVMNDRLIQLRSGRLVLPVARMVGKTEGDRDESLAMLSDDAGSTWRLSRGAALARGGGHRCAARHGGTLRRGVERWPCADDGAHGLGLASCCDVSGWWRDVVEAGGNNARFCVFSTHAEDAARRAADRLLQPCRAYQSRRVLPAHAAVLRGVG